MLVEKPGTLYCVSYEDFLGPAPSTPNRRFRLNERVNRNNIMSCITRIFGISLGKNSGLVIPLAWMEVNHGFDYRQTFLNYNRARQIHEVFSPDEIDHFFDSFASVSAHATDPKLTAAIDRFGMYRVVRGSLDQLLAKIGTEVLTPKLSWDDLEGIPVMDVPGLVRRMLNKKSASITNPAYRLDTP